MKKHRNPVFFPAAAALSVLAASAAHAQQRTAPIQNPRNRTPLTTPGTQITPPAFVALRGSLQADKKTLKNGEAVTFTYSVTNTSKTVAQTVRFSSGQRFDIVVTTKGTTAPVWQMSRDMMYTMSLGSVTFAPGETKTFSGIWKPESGTIKPGASFVATAYLTAMGTGQPSAASRPASAVLTLSAAK